MTVANSTENYDKAAQYTQKKKNSHGYSPAYINVYIFITYAFVF